MGWGSGSFNLWHLYTLVHGREHERKTTWWHTAVSSKPHLILGAQWPLFPHASSLIIIILTIFMQNLTSFKNWGDVPLQKWNQGETARNPPPASALPWSCVPEGLLHLVSRSEPCPRQRQCSTRFHPPCGAARRMKGMAWGDSTWAK